VNILFFLPLRSTKYYFEAECETSSSTESIERSGLENEAIINGGKLDDKRIVV